LLLNVRLATVDGDASLEREAASFAARLLAFTGEATGGMRLSGTARDGATTRRRRGSAPATRAQEARRK